MRWFCSTFALSFYIYGYGIVLDLIESCVFTVSLAILFYFNMLDTNESASFIVFGRHPVIDAAKAGKTFDKILFQQGITGDFEREIRHLCRDYDIPLTVVPKERFAKFTKGNHQGVLGFLSAVTYYRIEDVLPQVYERGEVPLFVLLDGVTDIRNFGAIARTAEAAGAHAIVVPKKGAAIINGDAMKTAAGALSYLPVCRENSLHTAVETLKMNGVQIISADLTGSIPAYEADFTQATAIIMGAEGASVSFGLLQKSDKTVHLPILGQTNSYNVSVAAGMLLYETMRQRKDVL